MFDFFISHLAMYSTIFYFHNCRDIYETECINQILPEFSEYVEEDE
eukprot:gene745-333_t